MIVPGQSDRMPGQLLLAMSKEIGIGNAEYARLTSVDSKTEAFSARMFTFLRAGHEDAASGLEAFALTTPGRLRTGKILE